MLTLIRILVGVTAVLAAAELPAQDDIVRVDKTRMSYAGYGYTIAPPSGDDWYFPSQGDGHVTAFYQKPSRRDMKKLHSLVAAVSSFWVSGCTDQQSCLDLAIEELTRNEPDAQLTTVSFETLDDQPAQPGCIAIKVLQHDRRVPEQMGKLFELHIDGLFCSHPSAPNLILNPNYSERVPSGDRRFKVPPDDIKRFLQSFEFRPVGPTVDLIVRFNATVRGFAAGDEGVWVQHGSRLSLIDVDSGSVVRVHEEKPAAMALASAYDSLWLGEYEHARLTRYDPTTGEVRARIALPGTPVFIVTGADSLWVSHENHGDIVRIDPRTNSIIAAIAVGTSNATLVAAYDALWVANPDDDSVYRIDVAESSIASKMFVCDSPVGLAAVDEAIWVGCSDAATVARIDPTTNRVTDRYKIGGSPFLMDGADGVLWIANAGLGTVSRFDISSGTVTDILPIGLAVLFVRALGDTFWISDFSGGSLLRLASARPD